MHRTTSPTPALAHPRAPRSARRRGAQLLVVALLGSVLAFFPQVRVAYAAEATFENRSPVTSVLAAGIPILQRLGIDSDAVVAAAVGGRRRAAETVGAGFSTIGVSLPALPAEPVLVRTRPGPGQAWGPWQELAFSDDHGPDVAPTGGRPGHHSEPLYVGGAQTYELNLPADATAPEVHLGREQRVRRRVTVEVQPAGAVPFINPRSSWGARAPSTAATYAEDFRLAVVHHSVSANEYSPAEVPGILRSIQAYHMDVNGWSDIGYNFAVDRFGGLWEAHGGGVDRMVIGGHARGFNTGSVGVVMLGEFGAVSPTSAALSSVASVIAWKFAIHGVDPNATVPYTTTGSTKFAEGETVTLNRIVGHRDVGLTACPGNLLYNSLGQIRSLAIERFNQEIELRPSRMFVGNFDGGWGDDVLVERQGAGFDPVWFSRGATPFYKANSLGIGIYRPAIGDFDGDGRDDVFWHGPGSTGDHLWFGNPAGFQGTGVEIQGSSIPFVGDFDGDGFDDLYLYGEGMVADAVGYGGSDRRFVWTDHSQTGTYQPMIGDFNADGRDDVFLHDPGQGTHYIRYGAARGLFDQRAITAYGSYEPFLADFDGNGTTDIFWYNPSAGGDHLWFMSTTKGVAIREYVSQVTGRYLPVVGDFDGNRQADIFWYAPTAPRHTAWYNVGGAFGSRVFDLPGVYQPAVLDLEGAPEPTGNLGLGPQGRFADILWYSPNGSAIWRGRPDATFAVIPT